MIQAFLENYIKEHGKAAFMNKLTLLENFTKKIKRTIIISFFINLFILIGSIVYFLINVIDFGAFGIKLSVHDLLGIVTILDVLAIVYALFAIFFTLRKWLKINIVMRLIIELKQEITPLNDLDEIILMASKWVRKMSIDLTMSRTLISRTLVKAKPSDFNNLKHFML